jgi:hypothetical protein
MSQAPSLMVPVAETLKEQEQAGSATAGDSAQASDANSPNSSVEAAAPLTAVRQLRSVSSFPLPHLANSVVAEIHDRMPLILTRERFRAFATRSFLACRRDRPHSN